MAESFVRLPADSTGKQLKTWELPDGTHVEIVDIAPDEPSIETFTTASVAAGASTTFTTSAIAAATTGRLAGVDVAASVPIRVEILTVAAGVPTSRVVTFRDRFDGRPWRPPHPRYVEQSGGATNHFRVTVTNLDTVDAADVYTTIYWDEV